MPARQIDIQWPFKGLNESQAFARQSGGQDGTHTTAKCENVVGFDPATGRNRGAARAGTIKYCPARIDGAAAGQCLVHVVGTSEITVRDTGPNSVPPSEARFTASGLVRTLGPSTPVRTGARTTTIVGVSNGTVGLITTTGVTVVGSGTAALSSSRTVIFAESFFKDIYFCDGANYKYYDVSANEMVVWETAQINATATTPYVFPDPVIYNCTNTIPILLTVIAHGRLNGDRVTVTGCTGNTAANGTWTIEQVTTNTMQLTGSAGNGTYTGGGTVSGNTVLIVSGTKGTMPAQESGFQVITGATVASPIVITIAAHGFTTGDLVIITGVLGNTAANGTWPVVVVTQNTFSLTGSTGTLAYTSGGTCSRLSGSRCALIAVWGGRIILSGLETDPNNIFMSAVGDPFDFDYAPATQTVQQAVAGSVTSGFGKNPDIVTALIPYTDDVLLIGGTHSIRRLLGNPAEGGINVSVTDITGVAYGSAWCQSPEGIIYFFGSRGGVFRIDPENGVPNRLTALTIDERLSDISLDENVVTLEWHDRSLSVRIYITPIDGTAGTHYAWDVRNEAWWPFSYVDAAHNPMACHLLAGNAANDRRILEYGQDGYVRSVGEDTTSDDGNPISSFVYLGPFSAMMFMEITATLSENSGNVTWGICSASSMERALDTAPRQTGRFKAGRNACQWPRAFIEQGYLRLSATGPWALESLTVAVDQVSDTMKRVMRSTP